MLLLRSKLLKQQLLQLLHQNQLQIILVPKRSLSKVTNVVQLTVKLFMLIMMVLGVLTIINGVDVVMPILQLIAVHPHLLLKAISVVPIVVQFIILMIQENGVLKMAIGVDYQVIVKAFNPIRCINIYN